MPEVNVRLRATGGQQASREVSALEKSIADTRAQVERFSRAGGLGALGAGAGRLRSASQSLDAIASRTEVARLRFVALIGELREAESLRPLSQASADLAAAEAQIRAIREELALTSDQGDVEILAGDLSGAVVRAAALRSEVSRITQSRSFLEIARDIQEADKEAQDLEASLEGVNEQLQQVERTGGRAGVGRDPLVATREGLRSAATGLQGIARVGAEAGVPEIADVARLSADVVSLATASDSLGSALRIARSDTVRYLQSVGETAQATRGFTSVVAGAVAPLGSAASGAASLAVAAAPFAGIALAAGAAYLVLSRSLAESRKAVELAIDAENRRIEAIRFAIREASSLTQQSIEDQLLANEQERRALEQKRDTLGEIASAELEADGVRGQIGKNFELANALLRETFGVGVGTGLSDAIDGLRATQDEIDSLNAQAARLQGVQDTIAAFEQIEQARQDELRVIELTRTLTSQQLRERLDGIEQERTATQAALADSEEELERLQQRALFFIQQGGTITDELASSLIVAETRTREYSRTLEGLNAETALLTDNVRLSVINREREERRIEATNAQLRAAAEARQEERQELERSVQATRAQADQRAQAIDGLFAQIDQLQRNRLQEEQRREREAAFDARQAAERANLEQQIEAAREREKLAGQQREIVKVREQATQQERLIVNKAAEQQRKDAQKLTDQINQINNRFIESERKAVDKFRTDELRRTEDYNRERLRLIESLNQSLLGAALDNDVNAFLEAQRRGLTDLAERSEDFSIAEQRRDEDFQAERAEAERQRQTRINDLQTTFAQEQAVRRQAQQQTITDLKQSTRVRVEELRKANTETLSEVQQLQEQLKALELRQAQEREAERRRIEQEAYQNQLNDLVQQRERLRREFDNLNTQATQTAAALGNNIITSIINSINAGQNRIGFNQPVAQSFGGNTVNVSAPFAPIVGDIATPRQVQAQLQAGFQQYTTTLARVLRD